jgi:hypothetical protein
MTINGMSKSQRGFVMLSFALNRRVVAYAILAASLLVVAAVVLGVI